MEHDMTNDTNENAKLAEYTSALDTESATSLRGHFNALFDQVEQWEARAKAIVVTDEADKRTMRLARESRLALREIRINAEKARKNLKEESLRKGKAIDGIANVIKALVVPLEEHLLEQEQFAERAQAARDATLRASRLAQLAELGADAGAYADLATLTDETWAATLESATLAAKVREEEAKRLAEEREAAAEAARKAEVERAAREQEQAAEMKRLQDEAARLREANKQAEAERDLAERAKADAERGRANAEALKQAAEAKAERAQVATLPSASGFDPRDAVVSAARRVNEAWLCPNTDYTVLGQRLDVLKAALGNLDGALERSA
jgi:hypothetical protein